VWVCVWRESVLVKALLVAGRLIDFDK